AAVPFITGREQEQMLLPSPRLRRGELMFRPPNLDEADALRPGGTPIYAAAPETAIDVETPGGETYPIDDPTLITRIRDGAADRHTVTLVRSDRSMTDCRPISVFGIWTARQLSQETGTAIDQRRFRANIYIDFESQ